MNKKQLKQIREQAEVVCSVCTLVTAFVREVTTVLEKLPDPKQLEAKVVAQLEEKKDES